FLERIDANAVNRVDEALVFMTVVDVRIDQARDHVRHLLRGERRPDHLAERRVVALRSADRNLIPFRAILVYAANADVTHAMMAARIHAARDVEIELTDVMQIIEIVEAALDRLGNRYRFRVRQRAEVAARAA